MNRRKLLVILVFACLLGYGLVYYRSVRSRERWVTIQESKQGFEPGIITNGKSPRDVTIEVIKPNLVEIQTGKPGTQHEFAVHIAPQGCEKAPTFVTLRFLQNKKIAKEAILVPGERTPDGFIFVGTSRLPENTGVYNVTIAINYQIFDTQDGNSIAMKPYRKTLRWGDCRVKN